MRQAKMKQRQQKNDILLISHQATLVLEKHRFAHRPYTSEEDRNVVLFCYADNKLLFQKFKKIKQRNL